MGTMGILGGKNLASYRKSDYGLLRIIGYTDSSYTRDINDQNSITRYCFFFEGAIITWCNKRQQIVSTSTSEADYMAISHKVRKDV